MNELKFLRGSIDNFNSLTKNGNYFYLVENDNNFDLYIGDDLISKSSTPNDLLNEINRAISIENDLQSQIDSLILGNVDLSDYYNKSEVDNLIANVEVDLSDYYNKSETYSQSEVNELINNIPSNDVDLSNYYNKSETYSQSEVNALIDGIGGSDVDLTQYYTKTEVDQIIYDNITKVLNTPT